MSSPDLPPPVPPPDPLHPFAAPPADPRAAVPAAARRTEERASDDTVADGEAGSPGASLPGHSLPSAALWSDSDTMSGKPAGPFSGLVHAPAEPAMPTIGHIGRYALKYQLGTGGLGTVFAAHDPLLSRLIAVKTLNVEISAEERESFNQLFINEARAAGGLSHPHIVTVFDAGISDDRVYIAMELLKGRDLRQLMQEGWRATPAQAVLIVRRVADALAYAHSKGVIHRDIKPANIFMVGRTQPRVLDFGIARVTHRHETDANAGAGSPYYMAPEQVRGVTVDRRADVFSLGVVLYELLTGRKPFGGDSLKAISQQVLEHEPPLAHKVDKTVPRDLAEIVARALEKDPDRRFRSARSFARELRAWLDVHTVGGEADGPMPPLPRPPLRRRWWIAGGVAGAVLVASAASFATLQWMSPGADGSATPTVGLVPVARALPPPVASPLTAPVATDAPAPVDGAASPPAPIAAAGSAPEAAVEAAPVPAPGIHTSATTTTVVATTLGLDRATAASVSREAATAAAAAAPAVPPKPVAATAAGPTTTAAPPPPRETLRERRQRETREREAREREARASSQPAAPVGSGTVRLAISPWGLVEIDGHAAGAAPPLTELTLAEGRHQVVVRNGDFAPFTMTVDVVAGQVMVLRHRFGS